ncbi:hypothetical protein BDF21DRAFT_411667 [Thamnidium elegans]|nr:hypothetical protein BDF21DRAFT_411667 [Thamnidium elegans]
MSNIFNNIKVYIIPIKLSEYELAYFCRLVDKHGGSVCQNQKESTLILTALRSLSRINRNIKNHEIPVIDIQWLKGCDKANDLLSFNGYILVEPIQQPTLQQSVEQSAEILNRKFSSLPPEKLLFEDSPNSRYISENGDSDDEENIDIDPSFINTKYECLRPTPYAPMFNKRLVSLLLILEKKRTFDNEDRRSLSYRHAISAIKAYPREIKSSKEAAKIIGVGKKMAEKIRVFLNTGTIEEAELLRSDEKFRTLSLFNRVFGAGVVTANSWWNLGYRTLQEVLDKGNISSVLRIGINLLPDFDQLMSREDVEEIIEIVKKELQDIDDNSFVIPVGGYRRGKEKNGDVDLLVSSSKSVTGLLDQLTKRLITKGFLKHKLWNSTRDSQNRRLIDNFEKCFCSFLQPSTRLHRQVDIIIVPSEELPMAVLGWTGSRQFERSIRDYAKKEKGLSVNNQSIHKLVCGSKQKLTVTSERESFEIIGIPYIEPELRNC